MYVCYMMAGIQVPADGDEGGEMFDRVKRKGTRERGREETRSMDYLLRDAPNLVA